MRLYLETGPATIISTKNIGLLEKGGSRDNDVYSFQPKKDERLFLVGDFKGFHSYLIVTHSKFRIEADSVTLLDPYRFRVVVCYEAPNGEPLKSTVTFNFPIEPIKSISACKYGRDYDSFEIETYNNSYQKFPCDISFLTNYSEKMDFEIPLEIKYIGLSAKNGRNAHERLANGHKQLQAVLGELSTRDSFRTASVVLYKPGKLETGELTFLNVVETLEASLIQEFKPEYNIEHLTFPKNKTKLKSKLIKSGASQVSTVFESPKKTVFYSLKKPVEKSQGRVDLFLI